MNPDAVNQRTEEMARQILLRASEELQLSTVEMGALIAHMVGRYLFDLRCAGYPAAAESFQRMMRELIG